MASAGTSSSVTAPSGNPGDVDRLVPRPADADEVRQLEQLVGRVPAEDLRQRVSTVMKNSSASS
jgi:hypothetical protein